MPRRLLSHLRANAVAYLALFVALGGVSVAATQLPANSVGSTQLRDGSVASKDIRNGGIASRDLAKTVRRQLAALPKTGATGPAGPKGDTGADGVLASAFASGSVETGLTSSFAPLLALSSSGLGIVSTGAVTTSVPARLIATGTVEIFKPTSQDGAIGRAACFLQLASDGGAFATLGKGRETTYEAVTGTGDAVFRSMTFNAGADVAAGTHDVRLTCYRWDRSDLGIVAPLTARSVDLTVLALRR